MVIQNIHTKVKYNVTPEEWAGMGTKKIFKVLEEEQTQTVSNIVPPKERVFKKQADESKTTNENK